MFTRKTEINNVVTTPLRAEVGDVLLLQTEHRISKDVMVRLRKQLQEQLPGQRIIVLEAGLRVAGTVAGGDDD